MYECYFFHLNIIVKIQWSYLSLILSLYILMEFLHFGVKLYNSSKNMKKWLYLWKKIDDRKYTINSFMVSKQLKHKIQFYHISFFYIPVITLSKIQINLKMILWTSMTVYLITALHYWHVKECWDEITTLWPHFLLENIYWGLKHYICFGCLIKLG